MEEKDTKAALFGDFSSSDSELDNETSEQVIGKEEENGVDDQRQLFGEESDSSNNQGSDNEEAEKEEEKIEIQVTLPSYLKRKRRAGSTLQYASLPNFLNINVQAFDPATFENEENEEDDDDAEVARKLKLRIQNTIRWKFADPSNTDINSKKVSNSRFIKWSDGSLSLLVGSEMFDVTRKELPNSQQFVYMLHPAEGILQAQSRLESSIAFRPFSTTSNTHKKLTASVLAKHQKVNKTKYIGALSNPEASKIEMEKLELEKIRHRKKMEAKRKNQSSRYGGELTAEDLEEEEEEAMRSSGNRYAPGGAVGTYEEDYEDDFVVDDDHVDYDEDEDELEDLEMEQRILAAKNGDETTNNLNVLGDDIENDEEEEEEEDEEALEKARGRRRMVLEDEDD